MKEAGLEPLITLHFGARQEDRSLRVDTSWRSSFRKLKSDQLIADLAPPVAILVAVKAGRMLHQMDSVNMESKISDLARDITLLKVYRETTEDVNLPTGFEKPRGKRASLFSIR